MRFRFFLLFLLFAFTFFKDASVNLQELIRKHPESRGKFDLAVVVSFIDSAQSKTISMRFSDGCRETTTGNRLIFDVHYEVAQKCDDCFPIVDKSIRVFPIYVNHDTVLAEKPLGLSKATGTIFRLIHLTTTFEKLRLYNEVSDRLLKILGKLYLENGMVLESFSIQPLSKSKHAQNVHFTEEALLKFLEETCLKWHMPLSNSPEFSENFFSHPAVKRLSTFVLKSTAAESEEPSYEDLLKVDLFDEHLMEWTNLTSLIMPHTLTRVTAGGLAKFLKKKVADKKEVAAALALTPSELAKLKKQLKKEKKFVQEKTRR